MDVLDVDYMIGLVPVLLGYLPLTLELAAVGMVRTKLPSATARPATPCPPVIAWMYAGLSKITAYEISEPAR